MVNRSIVLLLSWYTRSEIVPILKLYQKPNFNLVNDCCEGEACTMYSIPMHLTFVYKVMSVNNLCVTNMYFILLVIVILSSC